MHNKSLFNSIWQLVLTVAILFYSNQILAAYTFSGVNTGLPSSCTTSGGGNYTCSSSVTLSDHVTFSESGTVTVTINGGLTINNYTIGSPSDSANVTFVVNGHVTIAAPTIYANISAGSYNITYNGAASTSGSLTTTTGNISTRGVVYGPITTNSGDITVNANNTSQIWGEITVKNATSTNYLRINQDAVVNGSIYTNSTSTTANLHVDIAERATINGAILALGKDYTYVNINYDAIVNGDVTAFGNDGATVKLFDRARINGNVKSTSVDNDDGDVDLNANARITGNVSAFGDISNYGQINGCAHSTYTSGGDIDLRSGSSNSGGSCCGSNRTSCSISCVSNSSSFATSLCQSAEAIVVNAYGQQANGFWPIMELWVNEVKVDTVVVNTTTATNYTFYANLPTTPGFKLDLVFPNDAYQSPTEDRNLFINSVTYRSKTILSTDTRVIRDWGNNSTEYFDGIGTDVPNVMLHSNGAMRFNTVDLIAYYALDETSWNGTTNETKDTAGYTGGPFDGQGIGTTKPTAVSSSPALSGTTGTCGYANFSGNALQSAFTLDGLPTSTTTDAKTTVSFWMYWDGNTNYSTPIGWNLYALSIGNSVFGFDTFNGDRYGISSSGLAIGWRHIVAVFNNGNVTQSQLYIDGVKQNLSQVRGSPNNSNAYVQSALNIARITRTDINNLGFNGGRIDEIKVYNGETTQAQVTADYSASHACTGMPNLLAYYQFEESTWTTSAGQVIDASGNGYHASVGKTSNTNYAQTEDSLANRFVTSSPGTCGYAVFTTSPAGQGPIALPASMPNLTGSFTFATWYTALSSSATARRIFADDYNESGGGFVFSANDDGGTGKLRFAKRAVSGGSYTLIDTPAVINVGTKYFIAVSVNAVNQTATIYVFNSSGTLLNQTSGAMGYFGASNAGSMTIGGAQNPSGNIYLNHARLDEVSIYNSALTQAQILALLQTNHTCPVTNVAAANFNCMATGGSADTGRLYTQLSNTGFNIDVVALKSDRTAETGFVTSGTKNVTLEWMSGANNTCTTGTVLTPATTVTFSTTDNGRKTISVPAINNAYRNLRCRITDANQTPSVVGCSSDNFAVRPTSITVTSTNAIADVGNNSPSRDEFATPTFKAGSDAFNLTATTGVVGYDGTPIIATPTQSDYNDVYSWPYGASPVLPYDYYNPSYRGSRTVGTATGSFSAANSATGNATGNFTYSEVGYFRLGPNTVYDNSFTAVDSANGDCSTGFSASGGINACSFGNTNITNFFGRFIPDHFTITPSTPTPACSNAFTYFGQDGLSTTFTIQAQNAANQVTQNYTNNAANENEYYGKLSLSAPANFYFTASTLPAGSTITSTITTAGSWVRGSATVTAKHLISRPTSAAAPTNISISAKPVDIDGVTMPNSIVATNSPFRYGRIYFPNTFGSELLPLVVPIQVQYWNGLAYLLNTADSCTDLSNANFGMSNYKGNLSGSPTCETRISSVGSTLLGLNKAILSAPGWGNNGSVDLTLFTNNTTGGLNTCTSLTPSAATSRNYPWFGAPAAKRATFGIFKSPIIYMHENY